MSPFANAQLLPYLNWAVHMSCFQVNDTLKFQVTLQDEVGNGLPNNLVAIPVTLIILDENDNAPVFKDVSNFCHCFKSCEYELATSAMADTYCLKVRALCSLCHFYFSIIKKILVFLHKMQRKLNSDIEILSACPRYSIEFQFCVSVHHIMINKNTSLMQLISIYFTYSKSLHVSGRTLPIIRRI